MAPRQNRYIQLMCHIFEANYTEGAAKVPFERTDLESAAESLGIDLPKNLGDVLYSLRYRVPVPASIAAKAPAGKQWVIRGVGRSKYEFAAVTLTHVVPTQGLIVTKVPDATPEILLAN